MNLVIAILSGTPWWVFALLALLVGLGVQQLKPRIVRLPRIVVVPGVFLAWGLIALSTRAAAAPGIVLAVHRLDARRRPGMVDDASRSHPRGSAAGADLPARRLDDPGGQPLGLFREVRAGRRRGAAAAMACRNRDSRRSGLRLERRIFPGATWAHA